VRNCASENFDMVAFRVQRLALPRSDQP